ncbi:hypothetical protein MRB53_038559 [Persea americana]|nr:hypothetical protein MRB53_038559 [Persea americana]
MDVEIWNKRARSKQIDMHIHTYGMYHSSRFEIYLKLDKIFALEQYLPFQLSPPIIKATEALITSSEFLNFTRITVYESPENVQG